MLNELILDAFAPPLVPGTARMESAIRAIEKWWSVHLVCEVDDHGNRIRHDHDRPNYLASSPHGVAFLASPDDEPTATLSGLLEGEFFAPGDIDELHLLGHLPPLDTRHAAHGLLHFAEALDASWAMVTPEAAHGVIVQQVIPMDRDEPPPTGLPRLDPAEHLAVDVPRRLGWISYWSDRAAANIGFTASTEGLAAVTRFATGWIVQLTEDPLDLDRADHLAALRDAYARFPSIGHAKRA